MLKSQGSLKLHVKDLHIRPTERNLCCKVRMRFLYFKLLICSAMLKSEGSLKLHVKDLHERPTEKNIRCKIILIVWIRNFKYAYSWFSLKAPSSFKLKRNMKGKKRNIHYKVQLKVF
jgi:hypothetical protein